MTPPNGNEPAFLVEPTQITYAELKAAVSVCKAHVQQYPGEDPPDGYESLEPNQSAIADACWHRGMEQLETEILNWLYDKLAKEKE